MKGSREKKPFQGTEVSPGSSFLRYFLSLCLLAGQTPPFLTAQNPPPPPQESPATQTLLNAVIYGSESVEISQKCVISGGGSIVSMPACDD